MVLSYAMNHDRRSFFRIYSTLDHSTPLLYQIRSHDADPSNPKINEFKRHSTRM